MSKKITIELVGDDLKINKEGEFIFDETMLALGNLILHTMREFHEAQAPEYRDKAKETIYHYMNERFSAILELFAPDIEMRPNLTVDAIMKAQDELLMSEMQDATGDK